MRAKKPRHAEPAPSTASPLAALPPILLENVLGYLVDEDALAGNGNGHRYRKLEELHAMASAASVRVLRALYIPSEYRDPWCTQRTRSEVLEIRRKVVLRRAHLQRLVAGDSPDYGSIGCGVWSAVLSHVPTLKTLELATVYLESRPSDRIVDLTMAAARHCHELQTLTLPHSLREPLDHRPGRGHHMRALSKTVYNGLKLWSSDRGGLRRLCFPMEEIMKSRKDATTYIDHVVRHCPQIERLDGVGLVGCREFWKLDLETWERFCRTCDQLEDLYWSSVPFATQFFEVFGRHAKPKLRFLALSASSSCKWDQYFKAVDAKTASRIKATGYGASAAHPEQLLHATPNLEVLRLERHEKSRWWIPDPDAMDPELFGDDFVEAAVGLCKKLTHFTHAVVSPDGVQGVHTFTDRSLRALATLPDLEWLDALAVNITGDGLFDLVAHRVARTRSARQYYLQLGSKRDGEAMSMAFYDVLAGFLERLVAHEAPLPCATRRVAFHLVNLNEALVEEGWSAAYFGHVMDLAEQAHALHPSLQLRILVHGYDDEFGVMKRVLEFAFATETAELRGWREDKTDVGATDEVLDDVFVNRSYYDNEEDD